MATKGQSGAVSHGPTSTGKAQPAETCDFEGKPQGSLLYLSAGGWPHKPRDPSVKDHLLRNDTGPNVDAESSPVLQDTRTWGSTLHSNTWGHLHMKNTKTANSRSYLVLHLF